MELMNTPMNAISNQNENLIQSGQNGQQNTNVNQYFVEKSDDKSSKEYNTFIIRFICRNIFIYLISISIFLGLLIPAIVIIKLDLYIRIAMISLGVIIALMLFIFSTNKIQLVKDISNGKVVVKVMNYLCFPKMKLNLDIENTHFHVLEEITQDEDGTQVSYKLLIINDYKNLVGIDLDTSNIKQKPAKYLYYFNNVSLGKYNYRELARTLNNFIGSSGAYHNSLFINTFHISQTLSTYMKFSDYFFTYHLKNPLESSHLDKIFSFLTTLINCFAFTGMIIILIVGEDFIKFIAGIIFLGVNIIMFIIYKTFKYCFDNILRIDCIYSKNFDRIFIGIVKYNKTKYINTFEYQMNNISRFILEKEGNSSDTNFNLKVVFKNNETQQICYIKNKNQQELEGLAYLLNERININSNNNIDSNEQV